MKPRTSHGEMVNYYLKMEPHLFKEAVQGQFERIREEREAAGAAAKEKEAQMQAAASDKSELVLYRCPSWLGCCVLPFCSVATPWWCGQQRRTTKASAFALPS